MTRQVNGVSPVVALIIVDVQHDFIDGSMALENCEAKENGYDVIPVINNILSKMLPFKRIFVTQDWHPENHVSFYSNRMLYCTADETQEEYIKIKNAKLYDAVTFNYPGVSRSPQILWPNHCIRYTKGASIHSDLKLTSPYTTIWKGKSQLVESYSAFYDNEKTIFTGLLDHLVISKVNTVAICGLALDYCVACTAFQSIELGFKTYVIKDACRAVSKSVNDLMENFSKSGISMINSKDIPKIFI